EAEREGRIEEASLDVAQERSERGQGHEREEEEGATPATARETRRQADHPERDGNDGKVVALLQGGGEAAQALEDDPDAACQLVAQGRSLGCRRRGRDRGSLRPLASASRIRR